MQTLLSAVKTQTTVKNGITVLFNDLLAEVETLFEKAPREKTDALRQVLSQPEVIADALMQSTDYAVPTRSATELPPSISTAAIKDQADGMTGATDNKWLTDPSSNR